MAFEQKPNTGSLFKNDRKESDTHPDYKGSALIDGLGDCWLARLPAVRQVARCVRHGAPSIAVIPAMRYSSANGSPSSV